MAQRIGRDQGQRPYKTTLKGSIVDPQGGFIINVGGADIVFSVVNENGTLYPEGRGTLGVFQYVGKGGKTFEGSITTVNGGVFFKITDPTSVKLGPRGDGGGGGSSNGLFASQLKKMAGDDDD